jgi:dihydroflavonol-4-reductase
LIIRSAARGWVAQVGPSDEKTGYSLVHVDDLVRGLVLAADRPQAAGQTYYLTGEPPCTWPELLATLSRILQRPVRSLRVPRWLAGWAGGAAELAASLTRRPLILNRDKVREAGQTGWMCAVAKAARELGYTATVPLAEGLRDTVQWYRRHGWL